MTVTSRLPALIDYLVTLFSGDPTLGTASPPVTIFDGTVTTMADSPLKLSVGLSDPDSTGPDPAGESQQSWAAMGRRARDEDVTLHCVAEAWSGADDVKGARAAVYGIVSAVEVLCQADTTQFGGNALYPNPGLTSAALLQDDTTRGQYAQVRFDLVFKSRIGG